MKIKNKNNSGVSKTRQERLDFFKQIEETLSRAGEFPIHPEAHFLTNYSWEGILTIRFESDAYSKDNNFAEARRRHLIGLLMGDLRRKWGKRKKQIYWVASTEFGRSGVAHCHIIFNFHPLMHTNKKCPDVKGLEEVAGESLNHICDLINCPRKSVDVNWLPTFDDYGLVGYIAKIEPGRPFKHFHWSSDPVHWIPCHDEGDVSSTKEGNQ